MFCLQARPVIQLQPDTLLGWYVPLGARAAIPALRMNPASLGGKPRAACHDAFRLLSCVLLEAASFQLWLLESTLHLFSMRLLCLFEAS
jgi:hypothetical protein